MKCLILPLIPIAVTERARHLRAQYALQCEDLKSRIRRRINRVPLKVRKMTIGELMTQNESAQVHKTQSRPLADAVPLPPPVPAKSPCRSAAKVRDLPRPQLQEKIMSSSVPEQVEDKPAPPASKHTQQIRPQKRKSSGIHIISDKENNEPERSMTISTSNSETGPFTFTGSTADLNVRKNLKRAKTNTTAPAVPAGTKRTLSRTTSKQVKASVKGNGVLSPRSHNSRTLPRSPIKELPLAPSPTRGIPQIRPPSPSKPLSPFRFAANAATSALSSLAKAGSRLARPLSRDKETYTIPPGATSVTDVTRGTNASPVGKMLPPQRPTATTSQALTAHKLDHGGSPQRATSQTSIKSAATEQSTSSGSTVITKSKGTGTNRSAAVASSSGAGSARVPSSTITVSAGASRRAAAPTNVARSTTIKVSETRSKTVLSPKTTNAGVKKSTAARVGTSVKRAMTTKKTETPLASTGRVLRKRT